jgi:hypothetical protein
MACTQEHPDIPDRPPLGIDITDVRTLFSVEYLDEMGWPLVDSHLDRPDSVPATRAEQYIDLAERALFVALQEEGHHASVGRTMQGWASKARNSDEYPDYFRKMAFKMSPKERAQQSLSGSDETQLKKAHTTLAWVEEEFGEDVLDTVQSEQETEAKSKWDEELQKAHRDLEGKVFEANPPETVNGWEKRDTDSDNVILSYEGVVDGTPSIATVYETSSGKVDAAEFRLSDWEDGSGNPREARFNRAIVSVDGTPFWALKNYLEETDANPLTE